MKKVASQINGSNDYKKIIQYVAPEVTASL